MEKYKSKFVTKIVFLRFIRNFKFNIFLHLNI